jgi:hypothetical protein
VPTGEVRRPVIVAPSVSRSTGGSKLGARKLGATTKITTASAGGFDFDASDNDKIAAQAAAAAISPAATSSSAKDAEALAAAMKDLQMGRKFPGAAGGSGAGSSSSTAGGESLSNKYKNAKGISSASFFAGADEGQARADRDRLTQFSGAQSLSSDAFFDRSPPMGSGGGGGGGGTSSGGRYDARAHSAEGLADLGNFVDKLTSAVGDDIRKMADTFKDRAAKAKDGASLILESLSGR